MHHASSDGSESRWTYLWVAEQLRQEILSGVYRPGKRLPGEPALARRFGVGRVTVAKALEVLQQSNLIFRQRGSGTYVQHEAARGAVNLTIGYLVQDISMLRSMPAGVMLESAHQYLEDRGHVLHLLTDSEFYAGGGPSANMRRMVRTGAINGLIVCHSLAPELLRSIGEIVPTVYGTNDLVPENVSTVTVDFMHGYYQATRHLLDLGHRKIGLLGGNHESSHGYRTHAAFRLALQLAGIDPNTCPVAMCGYALERCRPEIDRMLEQHPDLTAVICGDDVAAGVAIEAAQAAGRLVPQQLSVVGCNDMPLASLSGKQLTTLKIDFMALGREFVDVLLGRIYGRDVPSRSYHLPQLILRGTTAPPLVS